jgi:hypothetical protein
MVATAIFLPTFLMALLALSTPQTGQLSLPDRVTRVIDAYLEYHSQPTQTLRQIIPAGQPGNFTHQMSRNAFGGTYRLGGPSPLPWWATEAPTATPRPDALPTITGTFAGPGYYVWSKPLPFPPVALWCVLLRSTADAPPDLVYVALHEDAYDFTTVLMAHDPALEIARNLSAGLASVGCDAGQTP